MERVNEHFDRLLAAVQELLRQAEPGSPEYTEALAFARQIQRQLERLLISEGSTRN
jgi:cob(I)alamin adenosyltransferase